MLQALVGVVRGVVEQREPQVVLRQVSLSGRQLLAAEVSYVLAGRRVRSRRAVRHVRPLVQSAISSFSMVNQLFANSF